MQGKVPGHRGLALWGPLVISWEAHGAEGSPLVISWEAHNSLTLISEQTGFRLHRLSLTGGHRYSSSWPGLSPRLMLMPCMSREPTVGRPVGRAVSIQFLVYNEPERTWIVMAGFY